MRNTFIKIITEGAKNNKDIYLLTGDLGFGLFDEYRELNGKRFINVGVAECNMIGLAAGLALAGKNVFCYSIAPFVMMRPLEQIRIDICLHNLNVKLLGAGGGLSYGLEGITHHTIEDFAIMRSLPNMTVVAPADIVEAAALAKESLCHCGPIYLRLPKQSSAPLHQNNDQIKIGKGAILNRGEKICLMATGTMVHNAAAAINLLKLHGYNPGLVSLHTLKPLDEELIAVLAYEYSLIVTLEEHSIIGGLGSAVADVLLEKNFRGQLLKIALPDKYALYHGSAAYLQKMYRLDPESVVVKILNFINYHH